MSDLQCILDELSHYHRDRAELLEMYTEERLKKSLRNYYHDIDVSATYLSLRKDQSAILKKIK